MCMSRKCQKLQLRALVGRFGSQNAMVGRLADLGAGRYRIVSNIKSKYCIDIVSNEKKNKCIDATIEIYAIFEYFAFCSRRTKANFMD